MVKSLRVVEDRQSNPARESQNRQQELDVVLAWYFHSVTVPLPLNVDAATFRCCFLVVLSIATFGR